jgi:hypothetical protein
MRGIRQDPPARSFVFSHPVFARRPAGKIAASVLLPARIVVAKAKDIQGHLRRSRPVASASPLAMTW